MYSPRPGDGPKTNLFAKQSPPAKFAAMFKGVWNDLIHAGRRLAQSRGFTFVCVVSLGIGMGPVIAIPYGARIFNTPPSGVSTENLVEIITATAGPREASNSWSYPDYVELRNAAAGIAFMGWAIADSEVILPNRLKTHESTLFVSADYFKTLGVAMARGPGFGETQDGRLKDELVVILGHDFWRDQLESDPDIIGKTMDLNGAPHVVVGIAPEQFAGHLTLDRAKRLFAPLERHPRFLAGNNVRLDRSKDWVQLHGRLSPGVGIEQASVSVSNVTSQLAKQYPATNELKAGSVMPYHPLGNLDRPQLVALETIALTLTGTVLLVVCLNLSGMMQVRSALRERDLSIRQAIGASRAQLVRYLLSEAIILAALGGALASLVLFNTPTVLSWLYGQPIPPPFEEALRVDLYMIAVCVGLCLVTSLVFGLLPAARFSRPVMITALKDDAGGGGLRVGRIHRITAALQVAIAVPLIVMGGISVDRIRSTAMADLGVELDLLYGASLNLDALSNIAGAEDAASRIRKVRDNLAKASGVAAVTVADGLPLDFRSRIARVSLQVNSSEAPRFVSAHVTRVGDGYLDTMGIPLLRGRGFAVDDGAGAEMVTIISKALADQLFPASDAAEAIGKRLTLGVPNDQERPQQILTVVGVTADFPTSQMSNPREQLLLPLAQHPNPRRDSVPVFDDREGDPQVMLIARSAPGEAPAKLTAAIENVVHELDPEFKAAGVVTGVSLRRFSMDDFLTQSAVAGVSGGVILMLAALGIYGVVGLTVATRTREIAVRVSLGASRRQVIGLILFDVVKLCLPGVVFGLILAAILIRLNGENMGITLSNVEYLSYVVAGVIAILVAVLASLAPARRAASVQPMVAMRSQ
jgi:putative ABC transport system permease protein